MRTEARIALGGVLVLATISWCPRASAQPAPPAQSATPVAETCKNPQSPRVLDHYAQRPTFAVAQVPDSTDTVKYTRRSDRKLFLLKRCGQHYHCRIENVQPQCGQPQKGTAGSDGECGKPAPGSWIEVHTVFSSQPTAEGCDPESLNCCTSQQPGDPVLVLGYHAKVTEKGPPLQPIPVPWGFASAIWSGSTTGTNPPEPCKPPAQWSFILGCGFTVSEAQLGLFQHFDQARGLQHQLSPDLTRIPPH